MNIWFEVICDPLKEQLLTSVLNFISAERNTEDYLKKYNYNNVVKKVMLSLSK